MRKSTHTIDAQIEVRFVPVSLVETETAYPVVEIEFSYIPGRRAYTPRGESAPIDPPEPPEVEFISARLVEGDGLEPEQGQVDEWAQQWLADDDGYNAAGNAAEGW
jgi:hypothetical protein